MSVRLSSKGQLVLPRNIREKLHLKTGDQFQVRVVDQTIVLEQIPVDLVQKLCGKYTGHDFIRDLEEEHRQEMDND